MSGFVETQRNGISWYDTSGNVIIGQTIGQTIRIRGTGPLKKNLDKV